MTSSKRINRRVALMGAMAAIAHASIARHHPIYGGGGGIMEQCKLQPSEFQRKEKERKRNSSRGIEVYHYPDGFKCLARNQKNADRKHTNWLRNEK